MIRETKKTNIPWIGEIPSDWSTCRVKDIFSIEKEKANQKNPTILSLARDAIKERDISTNEGQLAASYEEYNPVIPGDLLLNPMDLYSGANCNVSEVSGVISPAYSKLRKKVDLNTFFFDYFFKVQYWTMAMFAHGKGVSFDNRWTLNNDTLKAYWCPFPSVEEQNKIVVAIRQKEIKINALIANEEKQIEKLKAYKKSLISEVVTKGLNPNVPMVDSGLEWIGRIPKGWGVIRLKELFNIYSGSTPKSNEALFYDGDIVWVTPADYKTEDVFIFDSKRKITGAGLKSCNLTIVENGSLVISKRAPIGTVAIAGTNLCTNQGCLSCTPKNKLVNTKFYYYVLSVVGRELDILGSGTTFKEISYTNFGIFSVPYPNYKTQNLICTYLDSISGNITNLIEKHTLKISLLQKYRQSMIYEYVTGKKEAK